IPCPLLRRAAPLPAVGSPVCRPGADLTVGIVMHERSDGADVLRNTGEHSLKLDERIPDRQPASGDAALADRALVVAASLLDDRQRLSDGAENLEIAQEDNGVCEIADLGRLIDRISEDSLLYQRHDAGHSA